MLLTARQHRRRLEGALFLEIVLFDRELGEQLLAVAVEDRLQFCVGEITVLAKILRHDRGHLVLLTASMNGESASPFDALVIHCSSADWLHRAVVAILTLNVYSYELRLFRPLTGIVNSPRDGRRCIPASSVYESMK